MRRCWILVLLTGCTAEPPVLEETDPPDTDPEGFVGCDLTAMAGDWAGDITQAPQPPWQMALTLQATAEIDAPIGTIHYTDLNGADPTYDCKVELLCLDRTQLEWQVVVERVTSDTSGSCADGYAYLRLDAPDRLRYEWGYTEFGNHEAWADLERTP